MHINCQKESRQETLMSVVFRPACIALHPPANDNDAPNSPPVVALRLKNVA